MSHHAQAHGTRTEENFTIRHYSALLLCALLLLFCINVKSPNYESGKHYLRLAATHLDLSSQRGRKDSPKATLLVLYLAIGAALQFAAARERLQAAVAPALWAHGSFDPESHLRPPPRL